MATGNTNRTCYQNNKTAYMAYTPETRAGKWWYAYEAGGASCVIANSSTIVDAELIPETR